MPRRNTILITDPSPSLLAALRQQRPDLHIAALDRAAPARQASGPLWCFIDWLLPDRSGLEMVRQLRDTPQTRASRITMVLDSIEPDDKRRALRAGADDYLIGPLRPQDLIERIDNLPGRITAARESILTNGAISLDPAAHQVRVHGAPVAMRPNEFRLLLHFMEHPDQVFSRTALIDRLGKDDEAIDDRTVDVWVGRLRRALIAAGAPDPLRTVRSLGYVMDSVEG